MFDLLVIEDEVILQPGELEDFNFTIQHKLKSKFVNKV